MPYTLSWYQPNRIILFTLSGDMTEAEVESSSSEIVTQYLDVGNAPIHLMYDAQLLKSYPLNLSSLRRVSQVYIGHPNIGWLILYGPNNPILGFFATTITQIMRVKFRSVASQEEALKVLARMDSSLEENIPS